MAAKTSRTRSFRFGPGSLESLELRVWTIRSTYGRHHRAARLIGTYDCYTEVGVERVQINENVNAWSSEDTDEARKVEAAKAGDRNAAEDLAGDLIEYALEDWVPAHLTSDEEV